VQEGDVRILATDLSTRILDAAKQGEYAQTKIDSLPPGYASRYFSAVKGSNSAKYCVQERLRKAIVFCRMNLSTPPFPMQGPMDIIFVRNVMIYFDNQVRKKLLAECYRLLKPGGYLLVGHSESLTGIVGNFKCLKPSIYSKPAA
jgi:chemotaxis protein methyltransferase CheR